MAKKYLLLSALQMHYISPLFPWGRFFENKKTPTKVDAFLWHPLVSTNYAHPFSANAKNLITSLRFLFP
ncbi:MAG: hypothetical protein IKB86_08320 [Clostridia bacterium]|nr:hypothetical protein [Clostridia bacterium]